MKGRKLQVFPFNKDIENDRFLVIGGGKVAAGKVSRLLMFTENITVVAKEIDPSLKTAAAETAICINKREFRISDLDKADIVILATGDHDFNREVGFLCRERHIPVNAVDDPENCSFYFPAIIKRGKLVISISTQGASPACAAALKNRIEEILPDDIEGILDDMAKLRQELPKDRPYLTQKERAEIYKEELKKRLQ